MFDLEKIESHKTVEFDTKISFILLWLEEK